MIPAVHPITVPHVTWKTLCSQERACYMYYKHRQVAQQESHVSYWVEWIKVKLASLTSSGKQGGMGDEYLCDYSACSTFTLSVYEGTLDRSL